MRSPGRIAPPHRRQVVAKLAVRWKTATQSPLLPRDTRRSGRSRQVAARGLQVPWTRREPGGTCRAEPPWSASFPPFPSETDRPSATAQRVGVSTRRSAFVPGAAESWSTAAPPRRAPSPTRRPRNLSEWSIDVHRSFAGTGRLRGDVPHEVSAKRRAERALLPRRLPTEPARGRADPKVRLSPVDAGHATRVDLSRISSGGTHGRRRGPGQRGGSRVRRICRLRSTRPAMLICSVRLPERRSPAAGPRGEVFCADLRCPRRSTASRVPMHGRGPEAHVDLDDAGGGPEEGRLVIESCVLADQVVVPTEPPLMTSLPFRRLGAGSGRRPPTEQVGEATSADQHSCCTPRSIVVDPAPPPNAVSSARYTVLAVGRGPFRRSLHFVTVPTKRPTTVPPIVSPSDSRGPPTNPDRSVHCHIAPPVLRLRRHAPASPAATIGRGLGAPTTLSPPASSVSFVASRQDRDRVDAAERGVDVVVGVQVRRRRHRSRARPSPTCPRVSSSSTPAPRLIVNSILRRPGRLDLGPGPERTTREIEGECV